MVSSGELLIGARYQVFEARVAPLLAHEIGTHVLTYANGTRVTFCFTPLTSTAPKRSGR